jgi:hypothetical protein
VKDPPPYGIVGNGEENVLCREVSVAAVLGPLGRDNEDPFKSRGEHDGLMLQHDSLRTEGPPLR